MVNKLSATLTSVFQSNSQLSAEDLQLIEGLSESNLIPEPLAYAILFLGLANADGHCCPNEEIVIEKMLCRQFPEAKDQAGNLIESASNMLKAFRNPNDFISRIREEYSDAERSFLLDSIKKIVHADDREEPIEVFFERRYAKQLA